MPEHSQNSCYTITEFCDAHRISRSKFYQLIAEKAAPRLMRVGTKVLITTEAAADWRIALEAKSNPVAA